MMLSAASPAPRGWPPAARGCGGCGAPPCAALWPRPARSAAARSPPAVPRSRGAGCPPAARPAALVSPAEPPRAARA
eukprot:8995300-Pyramimonas_sp.AAC.1